MTNFQHSLRPESGWRVPTLMALVALSLLVACGVEPHSRTAGQACGEPVECEDSLCYAAICIDPAIDDDLDGLNNELEDQLGLDPLTADSDGDGLPDGLELGELSQPSDEDGDGIIDALESFLPEADDDMDCLPDQKDADHDSTAEMTLELGDLACCCAGGCAALGIEILKVQCKPDGDGGVTLVCDPLQLDWDGDGVQDLCDRCPNDNPDDPDLDDICQTGDDPDDPDDDDNCPDTYNPFQLDTDGDKVGDACDLCPMDFGDDEDGDTVCDSDDMCPFVDDIEHADELSDEDGDGLGLLCDPCPMDSENDQDADGLCADLDTCLTLANPGDLDTDGDGEGDACDEDDDNDGVPDVDDRCPADMTHADDTTDTDADGVPDACDGVPNDPDADDDGVLDGADNCVYLPNADQDDEDLDEVGDVCDTCSDVDQDGVCAEDGDNCPNEPNPMQLDLDQDGVGATCDMDDDNPDFDDDGLDDGIDNCPWDANANQADFDDDAIGDVCDDTDLDGDVDAEDCAPEDSTVSHNADERCNAIDDDCDGTVDEGFVPSEVPGCQVVSEAGCAGGGSDGVPLALSVFGLLALVFVRRREA